MSNPNPDPVFALCQEEIVAPKVQLDEWIAFQTDYNLSATFDQVKDLLIIHSSLQS